MENPKKFTGDVFSFVDENPVPTDLKKWGQPGHFLPELAKGPETTTWIWDIHATAHEFDLQSNLDLQETSRKVFGAHFGHLSIVFLWLSALYLHGARFSNYLQWLEDPTLVYPSAQIVWPIVGQEILNGDLGGGTIGLSTTSGLFQLWRSAGVTSETQLYFMAFGALTMSIIMLFAGWFHFHVKAPKIEWFQSVDSMLNHHLAILLGLGSLGWSAHQIHIALPINECLNRGVLLADIPLPHQFLFDVDIMSLIFPSFKYGLAPFFQLNWVVYEDFLTFTGGLNPVTGSLWLTDIVHHHLAISVIFLFAGHYYRTNWESSGFAKIEFVLTDVLKFNPFGGFPFDRNLDSNSKRVDTLQWLRVGHRGIYDVLVGSWHAQLAVNLAMVGSLSIIVAHHMYAMPPYPYIAIDYPAQLSLFTHHVWIGGFCICGAGAHASIFMVRDFDPVKFSDNFIDRILRHRDLIVAYLNWVCIFLGLHSFGLYVHNDTLRALGRPEDIFSDTSGLPLTPFLARWLQSIHTGHMALPNLLTTASYSFGGQTIAINGKIAMMPIELGTADFMVHHVHAFTIHVTALILLKGTLFARSSRLLPDKNRLGFRFPCDGPGRGGTCQSSAWDHVFLGLFWMYNCISVVIFHFSWKMQSDVWGTVGSLGQVNHITSGNFAGSALSINGWLRDFLWSQSSQVIQSYGSALSAYGLIFLGAHFIWAFSLMFLFSGRGYWQELIESILWAHGKFKVVPSIQPRALSIIQGRAVGLAHFLLGGIGTTWSFFLARALAIN
jgi:photosystem I P700 chlorophyll a apoprotein A1